MEAKDIKNPLDKRQIKRLQRAVQSSRQKAQQFREDRTELVKQYAGPYSSNSSEERKPVNLLELALTIYIVNLVVNNPKATVVTARRDLKPDAADLAVAVNRLIEVINLGVTLQNLVRDSMFGLGLAYIGIAEDDEDKIFGGSVTGKPYCSRIDLDDAILDMEPSEWGDCQFVGHKPCRRIKELKDDDNYDQSEVKKLEPVEPAETDETGTELVAAMTEKASHYERFEDVAELSQIYLPNHNSILIMPPIGMTWEKPIRCIKYDGLRHGPYQMLAFHGVPNNLMPLPPGLILRDLDYIANNLFNKSFAQSMRQKVNFGVSEGGEKDADRILNAVDGAMIKFTNPELIKAISTPGADPSTVGAAVMAKDLFFTIAGNLDVLGGLSPTAGTLGQEQLVAGSASKRLQYMQGIVGNFVRKIVRQLTHCLYGDPTAKFNLSKKVAGYDLHFEYGPDRRKEPLSSFDIDVDVHSMVEKTPAQKSQILTQIFTQIVAPMSLMIQSRGGFVDVQRVLDTLGTYNGVSAELADWITWAGQTPGQEEGEEGPASDRYRPRMPANTERTYTRKNMPGAMRGQKDADMANMLFGGGVQGKQAATLVKGVG